MVLSCSSKLQFLLLVSLLLVALFDTTSSCGRRRRHRHRHYHQTTAERYHGKRSVDYTKNNEVGIDDYENSKTTCGKTLCPKVMYYPWDEIIDAVDRLHEHLRHDDSNRKYFADKRISYDHFYTSERSKTLSRRQRDHWYTSDPSSGCKQHAAVQFPQQGCSGGDGQTYYVVNVPNLRQSVLESTCANSNQTCRKDKAPGASRFATACQQNYTEKQFVVLPMNKRRFEIEDFDVKTFVVPDSCTCAASKYRDNEHTIF